MTNSFQLILRVFSFVFSSREFVVTTCILIFFNSNLQFHINSKILIYSTSSSYQYSMLIPNLNYKIIKFFINRYLKQSASSRPFSECFPFPYVFEVHAQQFITICISSITIRQKSILNYTIMVVLSIRSVTYSIQSILTYFSETFFSFFMILATYIVILYNLHFFR